MSKAKAIFVAVILLVSSWALASGSAPEIKSFRDWKSEKVQIVLNKITANQTQIGHSRREGNLKNTQNLEKQLAQEQWNLEVAKDLSVSDYFVLYLTQQAQNDRYFKAALKLSPTEVAELMEAYSKTLGSGDSNERSSVTLPAQATSQGLRGAQGVQ